MLVVTTLLGSALAAEPPDVDLQGFVLRPEIHYAESSKARGGGLGFVIREGESRLALVPYQLFGAPSGMPTIPPGKMSTSVRKVALSEVKSGAWLVNAGAPRTTMSRMPSATPSQVV